MGLDAYVHCNCYITGKTKPFPLAELEPHLTISNDGDLIFDKPDKDDNDAFFQWKQSACEHTDMIYIWERISNWADYRYFQQALEDIGWQHFPTLQTELPDANTGLTSMEQAQHILEELTRFRQLVTNRELPFLINTRTGEVVYKYVQAYQGVFLWSRYYWLGVDEDGFFIARSPDKQRREETDGVIDETDMVFRSMRFEQRFTDQGTANTQRNVQYYDADTEDRFNCDVPIVNLAPDETNGLSIQQPAILHVETRAVDVASYDGIIDALTVVCQASIATGNPIVWY